MEQQSNSKKAHCIACTFKKHGVKTRKNIPHTCELSLKELQKQTKSNPGLGGT